MTKAAVLDLCNHIRERQEELGAEEGFRFRAYFDGDSMVPSIYGHRTEDNKAAERAAKQKATRRAMKASENRIETTKVNMATPLGYTPVIDPALLGPGEDSTSDAATPIPHAGRVINNREMQVLTEKGYPALIPINGPNDGPPMYFYPSAANLPSVANLTNTDNSIATTPEIKVHNPPRRSSRIKKKND